MIEMAAELVCPAQYNCTFELQDPIWWHAPLIAAVIGVLFLLGIGMLLWFAAKA